ncbi:gliding motility-associated C-terminal domain-containing protein [Adhaeribacter soli]|uniref:Gliding motility-associated C-terminal domain-containing protein n=1 Tax=Adhaeribacter soli TaxID=2607655 RepID=A0A5N1J391_9BACT|nr:gliding motility-associated C-terminal domain-containing protein [Adhaeribacter soli]KAA9340565.1 gliding motility-associated C-terminal domain-containing protein [Adhaeribacter soli]
MQDKDFDRFIQQALENMPEPDYNPADWDRLEDQLHNFQGTQPNAPAAAAKTVGGSLGKLGFVASAILVTAVNVVLFTKPELLKNSTATPEKTAVSAQNTISAASGSAIIPGATERVRPEASQTEVLVSVENSGQAIVNQATEASETSGNLPDLSVAKTEANGSSLVLSPAKPESIPGKNKTKVAGGNKRQPAATWNWSGNNTANRSAAGVATSGMAGGKPGGMSAGKAAATSVGLPCAAASSAQLAAVVVQNDTVKGTRLEMTSCQLFEANFLTGSGAAAYAVITSNVADVLPGARLSFNKENGTALLQWNPQANLARFQPYSFTIWVADERCPNAEPKAYEFAAAIAPAFTVAVSGNTKLTKGQETALQVTGAPAGSIFRWTKANAVVADLVTAELRVAPQQTTTYKLQVISPAGCTYSDSVKVEVAAAQPEIVSNSGNIPNIITPNNDGKNDYFKIQLPEAGPYRLEILDRWGNQVYASDNYENQWKGENLSNGIYYYILTVKKAKKTYKGAVEVAR